MATEKQTITGTLKDFPNQSKSAANILRERGQVKAADLLDKVASKTDEAIEEITELHKKYLPE